MVNANEKNSIDQNNEGANGPNSTDKLKEYGKKAYAPLLNVVTKYQDEFTPYLNALAKGLQGGAEALKKDADESEKYVAHLFQEAANGLNEASSKLGTKDVKAFSSYISDMAEKRPSLMFGTSYVAGIFFGRLTRHILSRKHEMKERESDVNQEESNFSINTNPSAGEQIH